MDITFFMDSRNDRKKESYQLFRTSRYVKKDFICLWDDDRWNKYYKLKKTDYVSRIGNLFAWLLDCLHGDWIKFVIVEIEKFRESLFQTWENCTKFRPEILSQRNWNQKINELSREKVYIRFQKQVSIERIKQNYGKIRIFQYFSSGTNKLLDKCNKGRIMLLLKKKVEKGGKCQVMLN